MNIPIDVLIASKKVYDWETANIIKKLWLTFRLRKPKYIHYKLLTFYPMSEELYRIFPHSKFSLGQSSELGGSK